VFQWSVISDQLSVVSERVKKVKKVKKVKEVNE